MAQTRPRSTPRTERAIVIRDLAAADENQTREADILVVGAGTAGLLIAVLLSRKGSHVVVVESGGEQQAEDRHPLNEVVQLGETYHGAEDGRFRCLGGRSPAGAAP